MKSIITALIALTVAGSASAATIWVAPASQKIRPNVAAPAASSTVARIAGAKNEFEAFQVVVTGEASNVSMAIEGLNDGAGHTIAGRDITLYREALINVTQQSGADGATGVFPDALVPDVDPIVGEKRNAFPFSVPANESRTVFVDVHAPQGTPAGVYKGTINITGSAPMQLAVEYTVWDFEVPSTSTLKSAYGMAWNGPCMGHGDGSCSNTQAELALRARYVQAALDNHISIYAPYYTATVKTDGSESWTDFDQYVGPFMDGTANTRLQGAKLTAVQVNGPSTTPVVGGWAKHFKAKGWFDRLFSYICDEPPMTCAWSDIDSRIAASRAADPDVPTLVTTTTKQAQQNGISQKIDLFVPVVNFMEGKPGTEFAGNQRAAYPATTWWYQSCMSFGCSGVGGQYEGAGESGWPSFMIDTDGTRNRAQEWMSFTYDVQGELYYETTQSFFSGDPWVNQTAFGGTGDGTLFYPGTTAKIGGQTEIPVESLRMKGIRDGMEDYELLALAKKLGMGDQAKALATAVYSHTYVATTTPATIDNARAELAKLILHALGKDTTTGTGGGTVGTGDTGSGSGTGSATGGSTGTTGGSQSIDVAGFPTGGCSSSGVQQAWLAIPFMALFMIRRRKRALAKIRR